MRIQTVVQHDPRRDHLLEALLRSLPAGARAITDPGASDARRSPWRGYLACLEALDGDATHLLVVQDDAQACRDFHAALELVVGRHPGVPLVLFTPGIGNHGRRILDACADDKRFVQLDVRNSFVPCVAVAWPRECVESILAFTAERPFAEGRTADDGNLGVWAQATATTVLATVPSLVEHPDVERSLVGKLAMGGRNPARCAACWTGPDWSPLHLDW